MSGGGGGGVHSTSQRIRKRDGKHIQMSGVKGAPVDPLTEFKKKQKKKLKKLSQPSPPSLRR